jgi:hypothetical protein
MTSLYSPDATALWADIEPLVRALLSTADCIVTVRWGEVYNDTAHEWEFSL